MNDYFHRHAFKNNQAGISKCIVVSKGADLVGYFCWNHASVTKSGLDIEDAKGLPGYPIPAILISRLAVDKKFQGQGIGPQVLRWAFERAIELAEHPTAPSFRFIFVDAIDTNAELFYKKFGFKPFIDRTSSLYISLDTIRAAAEPE